MLGAIDWAMRHFRAFGPLLLCTLVFGGCYAARVNSDHSEPRHYDIKVMPDLDRSLVDSVVRAALAEPVVKAHPERYSWISVRPVAEDVKQKIVVELHGYMDGYVVRLTNSVSGWRVA